ncbi:MAG TPA: ankyrin repeat domain-containing protein [Amoebophilaceae bacterium]|nr:ankyrin repeat domain-containing protein [Amoebophilaceae bacterium]
MNRKTGELTETPKTGAVAAAVLTVEVPGLGLEADNPTVAEPLSIDVIPHKRQRRSDSDSSSGEEQLRKDGELIEAIINKKLSAEQCIEKISKALNRGANINFKDGRRKNNTPLHLAVKRGVLVVVEFLLKQQSIDINIKNNNFKTPLALAKELNKSEIIKTLGGYRQSPLEHAASENRPGEAVPSAIAKPQSVVEETVTGQSEPTLYAIIKKGLNQNKKTNEIKKDIEDALSKGADVNLKDQKTGDTALHLVVKERQVGLVYFLVNSVKADKTLENTARKTPLELAEALNYPDLVRALKGNKKEKSPPSSFPETAKRREPEQSATPSVEEKNEEDGWYEVNSGTTGIEGSLYQIKLLMLFLYRGINQGYSFSLGSEWKDAGKFDDLIFKYKVNNKYLLLQAKHKIDEAKKIRRVDLLIEGNGDFSLVKYFDSYQTIKTNPLFEGKIKDLILFTNIDLDKEMKDEVTKVNESDPLLLFPEETKPAERYKFKEDSSFYRALISKLKFEKINQALDDFLKNELSKAKLDKPFLDALTAKVIDQIAKSNMALHTDPSLTKEKEVIKKDIDDFLKNELPKAKLDKPFLDALIATDRLTTKVMALHTDPSLTTKEIDSKLKDFLGHFTLFVNQPNQERLSEIIKKDIEASESLSLLDSEFVADQLQKKLFQWFLQEGKKPFLTPKAGKTFFKEALGKINAWMAPALSEHYRAKVEKKLGIHFEKSGAFQLKDLPITHYVVVPEVMPLQAIKLVDFLNKPELKEKSLSLPLATLLQPIQQQQVIDAFSSGGYDVLAIVCKPNEPTPENDSLNRLYEALTKTIREHPSKKLLLLSVADAPLAGLFQRDQAKMEPVTLQEPNFAALTEESQNKILQQEVNFQEQPIQLKELLNTEEQKQIIQGELLNKLALRQTVSVGTAPPRSSGYDAAFYIGRTFKKIPKTKSEPNDPSPSDTQTAPVLLSEKELLDQQEKVILIADSAGMGKTTVLTSLSQKIKEQNPSDWVVRIDLHDHTTALDKIDGKTSPVKFLANELLKLKEQSLAQQLFEEFFKEHRVALLLDGFDEISPTYTDKVTTLLKQLKESPVKQLWVTTRPHLKKNLEAELDQTAYTLEPFSEENQIDFLVKYWCHKNQEDLQGASDTQLKAYAQQLINKLAASVNDRERAFTGIPLQTQLLAEAFENEIVYTDPKDQSTLSLPNQLDLVGLYQRFIDNKYQIYQSEKNKADTSQPGTNENAKILKASYEEKLQQYALQVVLSEDDLNRLNLNVTAPGDQQQALTRIGLMHFTEGQPQFMHRTFAEYFTAHFFVERLEGATKATESSLQDFFLGKILLQDNYQVVRAFINGFWKKEEHFPQEAILQSYGNRLDTLWQERKSTSKDKTILDRAAREDNIQIIAFLQKSLKKHATTAKDFLLAKDYDGNTAFHRAAASRNTAVLEQLWKWGQELREQHLLTDGELKDWLLDKDRFGKTALHWAAELGNTAVLEQLWKWAKKVDAGSDLLLATDKYGQTVFHRAAAMGKTKVLEQLWKWGQELREQHLLTDGDLKDWLLAKDTFGKTALYWAAEHRNTAMLEQLWKWGQELREQHLLTDGDLKDWLLAKEDIFGKTALHGAAVRGNTAVLEQLWKWGQELREQHLLTDGALKDWLLDKDQYGKTALHGAAERGNTEVLEQLWKWGQERIDGKPRLTPEELKDWLLAKDKSGKTALHWAAERRNTAVLEQLWKWGQERVDGKPRLTPEELKDWLLAKDKSGKTALHWAAGDFLTRTAVLEQLWKWGQELREQHLLTDGALKDWLLAKDKSRKTALHGSAWEWGKKELTPEELETYWLDDKVQKEATKKLIEWHQKEVAKIEKEEIETLEAVARLFSETIDSDSTCSSHHRKKRSLGACEAAEHERRDIFPYEPWVEPSPLAEQSAGQAYRQLALAFTWQQGEGVAQVEEGLRHLGELLAEGVENQSTREQQVLQEQGQRATDFFAHYPKEHLLEPFDAAVAPNVGQSVLLEHGQQSLLLLHTGDRYRLYSPNLNYRKTFATRPGTSWEQVTAFAQAFLRWKSGSGAYKAFGLKTPFPAAAEQALRTSPLWQPDSIAPDRVLLERQGGLVEGLPLAALRQLFRVQGAIPDAAALQESFFTQKGLTLAVEALHTVLPELTPTQRQALSRVVQRDAIAVDPHWLKGLASTEQPLGQAYQQKVLERLRTGKEVTPEQLSQLSWQLFRKSFDQYPAFTPELKQKVVENTQNLQQQAGAHGWVKGMAVQTLFFLPDVLRAANTGNISGLATTTGMLAADGTVNSLYGKLLERLAPTLSESRLGLLQKLPITSPVFKGLTIYSIVELTQQLHTLPPHAEQRSAIQHRLGEQYVTIGIMAAELLGFEATPLWLGLMAEQLIFEALNFRKEYHLDIPFWQAFLMSLGFEQQKLQHIIDERQLVEANLALVEQLNQQPIPPYGWVLVKIPRLSHAHWRTIPATQVPQEIRKSIVKQSENPNSTRKKAIQENSGYRFVRDYQTHTEAVGRAARTVRGPLLSQAWQRKYFDTTAQLVAFDLDPSSGAYQEDNLFLKQPEADTLKHYQRISTVTTHKRRHYVKNPPVHIQGPGLGALYMNQNQSQPHNGQGRNLYYAFDPNEGDTTLRVTPAGLQALTTRYQQDHPAARNTSNTAYHITVQLLHKSYPNQIKVPPTQQPAAWLLNDIQQQLNSHYWIGTLQRSCSIYDNCPSNQLIFTTEPGRGYQLQSQGHEVIQLHPLAANLPNHTLWLKGTKHYMMLQLKGQQVKQLTLNARQVELFDLSGTQTGGEVHLNEPVQRFALTITGAVTIRHASTSVLEVKGKTADGEAPMRYSKPSGLQRPAHYQLVLSSLQPLLRTINIIDNQHITWSSPGLTHRWQASWYRQADTFLHISAATQPNCFLLLSHGTLTLTQLDNAGQPHVTLVDHAQPVAQWTSTGRLQRVVSATATGWLKDLTPEAAAFAQPWNRGMVLEWQTPNGARQWHRFPSAQVTLNGIHYQLYDNQLEAIGAEDNVIRGEQLLTTLNGAPLAIRLNQSLAERQLRWENDTLILNNLTLTQLPAQTPIYFNQQGFTFATLQETLQPAKPQARRRRALPMEPRELARPLKAVSSASAASVASSAGKPTSWIGDLWAWGKKFMVGSYSKPISLDPLEASMPSKPVVCNDLLGAGALPMGPTAGPTLLEMGDQWVKNMDTNGLLAWGTLLARKWTGSRTKAFQAPSYDPAIVVALNIRSHALVGAFMDQVQKQAQACGIAKATAAVFESAEWYTQALETVRKKMASGQVDGITASLFEQVVQQNVSKIASTSDQVDQWLANVRRALPKLEQQFLQQEVLLPNQSQGAEQANTISKVNIGLLKQAMCSMQPIEQLAGATLHMGNSYNKNHTLAQSGLEHGNQYTRCVTV